MPVHPADVEIFKCVSDNVNLLVELDLMSGNPQSQQDSASGDHKCLYGFMAVFSVAVVIFQCWAESRLHPCSLAATVAINKRAVTQTDR